MLLLWLSLIVMTPFDLISIDSSAVYQKQTNPDSTPALPIAQSIVEQGKLFLEFPGKEHEAAAILLTRLLTR